MLLDPFGLNFGAFGLFLDLFDGSVNLFCKTFATFGEIQLDLARGQWAGTVIGRGVPQM